jgi:hypothetical protein
VTPSTGDPDSGQSAVDPEYPTGMPDVTSGDKVDGSMEQDFEIISEIISVDTIAVGNSIRDLRRLVESYGAGRWRKLKGVATVRLMNARVRRVELHWYEAHGIGKKDFKIKRYLD